MTTAIRMPIRDYLVIDLEATCDDEGTVPKHEMEIIEIGAILVDGASFESKGEFQTFVRPVRHPRLTPFCQTLTTIRQEQVDDAPGFAEAIAALRGFMFSSRPTEPPRFGSWGGYDRKQFEQDAGFHAVELPFAGDHLNIKAAFSEALGTRRRFGMAEALRKAGLSLIGTHHRGIDDARNIARLLPLAIGGSAPLTR